MPEVRYPVTCMEVVMRCPKCSEANMKPTGLCLTIDPPKYPHVCPNCGYKENFSYLYPRIEYVRKDESDE